MPFTTWSLVTWRSGDCTPPSQRSHNCSLLIHHLSNIYSSTSISLSEASIRSKPSLFLGHYFRKSFVLLSPTFYQLYMHSSAQVLPPLCPSKLSSALVGHIAVIYQQHLDLNPERYPNTSFILFFPTRKNWCSLWRRALSHLRFRHLSIKTTLFTFNGSRGPNPRSGHVRFLLI